MTKKALSTAVMMGFAIVLAAGPRLTLAQSSQQGDPTIYLLSPEDLPEGFEHQLQRDRTLAEPGVLRALRFFTRGAPEVPTEDHASILLAASASDSAEQATTDFQQTVATWSALGYDLSPLSFEMGVGEEAVAGWDTLYEGTDHPKRAALVLFRLRTVSATVQWTDDPSQVTLDHATAIAQLMQLRIDAQASPEHIHTGLLTPDAPRQEEGIVNGLAPSGVTTIRQEAVQMYVRLVRFAFGPGKEDAARKLAADLVPAIGSRSGCKEVTFFGDHSDGEYGPYVLWDSQENADAAAAVIGPRLQEHLERNVQRPPERRLFEVFQTS